MSVRIGPADERLPFLRADRVVRTGVTIVVVFFFGFVGWAALAPLESAIISSGVVVSDTVHGSAGVSIALRVAPENADEVQPGMTARVDVSAHKARSLPMLTGLVTYVSPRALEDQRSGQAYFLARLSLDRSPLKDLPVRLLPGMPVRVEIPTGAHTALEYLIEPVAEVMHNGMREK